MNQIHEIKPCFRWSGARFGPMTAALACLIVLAAVSTASGQTTPPPPAPPAPAAPAPPKAQAPPAASRTGPISGYMDFHFNVVRDQDPILDFHRFVLLFSHSFSPRLRFTGELELEHAFVEGLEEAGEIELEQAYLDFLISRAFNVRAGMMLVPVGLINERHEPPVFNGVERPFVDTVIVPSTWFETGAGIHGELSGGWRYRTFVMAPLDALEFSAEEGLRGGRQKGSEAVIHRASWTGRVEYVGTPGLSVGASAWSGAADVSLRRLTSAVKVAEIDARYQRDRLELRGQYAHVFIKDAAGLNTSVEQLTGVSPNVASQLRGFYGEAAYRIWNQGSPRDLVAFTRYENFDTQYRMPTGFLPRKEFDREAWVTGITYFPDPDVAVKVDYVRVSNRSGGLFRTRREFNIGLGWWF
jgi:hypothetical protein